MNAVEKLFIEYSKEYDDELEQSFFQGELNTHEYFDPEDFKQIVQVTYLNILMAEFYFEYTYKYFNEYFKINNSLKILGATQNDPQIKTCVEIIKDIFLKIREFKVDILLLIEVVFHNQKNEMQPSSATMLSTITFSNKYKKPQTALNMLEMTVRALIRAEYALSTLDHVTSIYFDKHKEIIQNYNLEEQDINNLETKSELILDAYLDLKLNHLVMLEI